MFKMLNHDSTQLDNSWKMEGETVYKNTLVSRLKEIERHGKASQCYEEIERHIDQYCVEIEAFLVKICDGEESIISELRAL